MAIVNHNDKKTIQSKNVRKFTSRSDVYDYLSNEVFEKEDFIRHVVKTAKETDISYLLAFDIITNHLTDILYEIDRNITNPKKKVLIRVYGYFSLRIGFMISNTRKQLIELLIKQRKSNESK
jgi:hypothetical protein